MENINELNFNYLKSLQHKLDPLLQDISDYADENEIPIVSVEVGKFLEVMTLIKNPENVLEVGTAIGFSGIFIARALKLSGKLTTIERSAPSVTIAKKNFTDAGVMNKVNLLYGDALKILPTLKPNFEMAFIDAQKEEYEQYLEFTIKLMGHGGVIIIDNLLWRGQTAGGPLIANNYKTSTTALQKFNKHFMTHPKIISTIMPLGDGTGLAVVR